jgi:hypothetical protein
VITEFADWRFRHGLPDRPWLLLGKGPTFARRHEHDLTQYNTMSLNHVVLEQPVDVAHMQDFDVVQACALALPKNCRYLLLPRRPNIDFRPAHLDVQELLRFVPELGGMADEGRIVVYDRDGVARARGGPAIRIQYFSAEAGLDALGHMGARTVRTLGVDGGTAYATAFNAIDASTRLANGQPSFSRQAAMLRRTAARHGMEVRPLQEPMRIFIGVDESQLLAAAVLEDSIRRHASGPVEVVPMTEVEAPMPKDKRNRPRTAFSFSRFAIPKLCGYEGRALYVDADMQVFDDVAELWKIPFDGAKVLCTNQPEPPEKWRGSGHFHAGRQMSVMMLDCSSLDWDLVQIVRGLDEHRYTYEQLMFDMCLLPPEQVVDGLPQEWNHLEHFHEGLTKLLHYTVVPTQPWKNDENPLRGIWEDAFVRAWSEGAIEPDLLERQIRKRHVKKSLRELAPPLPSVTPRAASSPLEAELRAVRDRLNTVERLHPRRVARFAARRLPGRG